ncbi:PP2C family serine/threonine-protein phosphatase [Adhaeretor mobilis]|uniref:PPM-type phosphatase domain-containing protein n=1 Tax=Adhaeretor mobilis TaxID=1930276 RepID=A0A517MW82_9BACT|nr:PP2C family serine/threonine-protein phosphatase [Adhaeretor mobilis]QDS99057.1 hypothetical protein HG15A2_23470 [Adhaeretor mobilis]
MSEWRLVYDSVRGTSHEVDDLPCQDSSRVLTHYTNSTSMLISVCADGAGSASFSDQGSQIACEKFAEHCQSYFVDDDAIRGVTQEVVADWLVDIRSAINDRAEELETDTRQLATTLLGCVIGEQASFFLQIGDGAMVYRSEDSFQFAFWPHTGEFANMTNFLTSDNFESQVEWKIVEEQLNDLAAFTDGLERLVLKFEDQTIHEPAITPMLEAIRDSQPEEDFSEPLRGFLTSEGVNERTDDDKTLILATRLNYGESDS